MRNEERASGDAERQREEDLCTTLLIAVAGCNRLLTQDEVDQLLGVRPPALA